MDIELDLTLGQIASFASICATLIPTKTVQKVGGWFKNCNCEKKGKNINLNYYQERDLLTVWNQNNVL